MKAKKTVARRPRGRAWLWLAIVVGGGCAAPAEHGSASPPTAQASAPTSRPSGAATADERGRATGDWRKWLAPPPPEPPTARGTDEWNAYQRELDAWLEPPAPDQPQPMFVCEERTVDAGDVWEGSSGKAVWTVFNAGEAPLRMRATFGGCMTPGGRTIFSLAPGETAEIEGRVGACFPLGRRSCCGPRVRTNDRRESQVDLDAITNVRSAIRTGFDSTSMRSFAFEPFSRSAGPQTKTIVIRRGDDGPLHLAVTSVKPAETATELREIEAGERYELSVTLSPPWPVQGLIGVIVLATGVERQQEVKIGFTTDLAPRVRAQPNRITVPRAGDRGSDFPAHLIWSDDAPPGRILEASIDDPAMSVRVEPKDGAQVVTLHVSAHDGPLERKLRTIVLTTDDPAVPEVRIPVFVFGPPWSE